MRHFQRGFSKVPFGVARRIGRKVSSAFTLGRKIGNTIKHAKHIASAVGDAVKTVGEGVEVVAKTAKDFM